MDDLISIWLWSYIEKINIRMQINYRLYVLTVAAWEGWLSIATTLLDDVYMPLPLTASGIDYFLPTNVIFILLLKAGCICKIVIRKTPLLYV